MISACSQGIRLSSICRSEATTIPAIPKDGKTQARNAISAAGGQIIHDLMAIQAIAALPGNSSFTTAISANPNVQSVWQDLVSASIPGFDLSSQDAGITSESTTADHRWGTFLSLR